MENLVQNREMVNGISEELSILIIDSLDEAGTLEQEIRFLGHVPQVVFSYKDALGKIKKNRFDMIIMDMDLPEGDWFSTIVWIRELAGEIHIVTMTGNNSREIEELAREQKVIYYVVKPLEIRELGSVIAHISKKKNVQI